MSRWLALSVFMQNKLMCSIKKSNYAEEYLFCQFVFKQVAANVIQFPLSCHGRISCEFSGPNSCATANLFVYHIFSFSLTIEATKMIKVTLGTKYSLMYINMFDRWVTAGKYPHKTITISFPSFPASQPVSKFMLKFMLKFSENLKIFQKSVLVKHWK